MEDLTVQLDDDILEILEQMAAASGLSIEEECRRILREWAENKCYGIALTRHVHPRRRKSRIAPT
jgi:plasmid stability protein